MIGPLIFAAGGLAAAGVALRNKRENRRLLKKLEQGEKERAAVEKKAAKR
jgi:hypothetical protein